MWKSYEKFDKCIRKSWESHGGQSHEKSWDHHEKVLKSNKKVTKKTYGNQEKAMKKSWKIYEKVLRKSWECHDKAMRKFW